MQRDNVVAMNGVSLDANKQQLLDVVATSFDRYVVDNGYAPEAIAYVLGGSRQKVRSGWLVTGATEEWGFQFLASAVMVLTKDIVS